MRLFLGIQPDQETLRYCRDVYRSFDKEKHNLKAIPNDQLYISIRFVGGRVSDLSKNAIVEQLRSMQGTLPKPEIKITHLQFGFPRQHDPRVLFANVEASDNLLALQDSINRIIKKFDFHDTITWKPHRASEFHISIARLKPAATRSTGRKVRAILDAITIPPPLPFVADELHVIQSIIDFREKPIYRNLAKIIL